LSEEDMSAIGFLDKGKPFLDQRSVAIVRKLNGNKIH